MQKKYAVSDVVKEYIQPPKLVAGAQNGLRSYVTRILHVLKKPLVG